VDVPALLQFLAVDLLLVLTPGADWAYALRAGLRDRRVTAAVAGLAGGYLAHAALVAAGVGALLARQPRALEALTLAGALYLLWLGGRTLRAPAALPPEAAGPPARRSVVVLQGALVSGLNPKGLLLFFAVLPQFVRPQAAWPVGAQLAVLGALHVLACAAVYALVAGCARSLLASRPRAARVVGRVTGLAMTGIGVGLVAGQVAGTWSGVA
jgi:threonine/homoserine/homoserine lactone efflux protein